MGYITTELTDFFKIIMSFKDIINNFMFLNMRIQIKWTSFQKKIQLTKTNTRRNKKSELSNKLKEIKNHIKGSL